MRRYDQTKLEIARKRFVIAMRNYMLARRRFMYAMRNYAVMERNLRIMRRNTAVLQDIARLVGFKTTTNHSINHLKYSSQLISSFNCSA